QLPGCIATPDTAWKLAAQLPPWPVTTLAATVLAEALLDPGFPPEARAKNQHAREQLSTALSSLGCRVAPSAVNFLLLRLPAASRAGHVRNSLLREYAILVRECDSF